MASDDCLTLMRSLAWPVTRCARVAPVRATCRRRAARQTPCGTGPHYGRCRSYGIRRGSAGRSADTAPPSSSRFFSAPNRSVAQEETLQAGEAVHFRSIGKRGFDGFRGTILAAAGRFIESERIGLESDVHAARGRRCSRRWSTRRSHEAPSTAHPTYFSASCVGTNSLYWSMSFWVSALKLALSSVGPPVVEFAVAVVLRALVVETVADLMADHRADAAVVRGILGIRVEERRLQNGGREHDHVHGRLIVGVHRLRIHQPFVLVDGLAHLGQLVAGLIQRSRHCMFWREAGVLAHIQRGIVTPMVRCSRSSARTWTASPMPWPWSRRQAKWQLEMDTR